jgi:hypothetical protein
MDDDKKVQRERKQKSRERAIRRKQNRFQKMLNVIQLDENLVPL